MNSSLRICVKEYLFLWVKVLIFASIGLFLDSAFPPFAANDGIHFCAFALPLMVYGLTFFNKVIRFDLFGNHDIVIFFWLLKIVISFVIGIFAFPIVNIYYITKIIYFLLKRN